MSDEVIVKNMIEFIESKERDLQASKFSNDSKVKSDIVNNILVELEREIVNED